jgi:uncharacterized protein YcbX
MLLTALHVFPVKSLQGFSAPSIRVDHRGLAGDRRFLVIDAASGEFLTQRAVPAMTQLTCRLEGEGTLVLHHASGHSVSVAVPSASAPRRTVRIWRDLVTATDAGDEAAAFLSSFLDAKVRLVHAGEGYHRTLVPPLGSPDAGHDALGFVDAAPVLITSEASLDALNERLLLRGAPPVPMDRFRPSLVLRDCPPFAEDSLQRFRIGNVTFHSAGPCARCTVITTDQVTGERQPEVLTTLADFRRDPRQPAKVNFGIYAVITSPSALCSVGDPLVPID